MLIAASFTRHLSLLSSLQGFFTSGHLSERLLIQEYVRRQGVTVPDEREPGYEAVFRAGGVRLVRSPLPDLEMERWEGQVRTTLLSAGAAPPSSEESSGP